MYLHIYHQLKSISVILYFYIYILYKILLACFYLLADIEIDRLDLSVPTDDCISNTVLPTCNRDATNVKDVYNIDDIIPRSKLEMLYEHAMEILNGDFNEEG